MRTNFRAWFKAMFFGGSEAIVGGRPEQIPRKFESTNVWESSIDRKDFPRQDSSCRKFLEMPLVYSLTIAAGG